MIKIFLLDFVGTAENYTSCIRSLAPLSKFEYIVTCGRRNLLFFYKPEGKRGAGGPLQYRLDGVEESPNVLRQ